jgi:hypothetical protein
MIEMEIRIHKEIQTNHNQLTNKIRHSHQIIKKEIRIHRGIRVDAELPVDHLLTGSDFFCYLMVVGLNSHVD